MATAACYPGEKTPSILQLTIDKLKESGINGHEEAKSHIPRGEFVKLLRMAARSDRFEDIVEFSRHLLSAPNEHRLLSGTDGGIPTRQERCLIVYGINHCIKQKLSSFRSLKTKMRDVRSPRKILKFKWALVEYSNILKQDFELTCRVGANILSILVKMLVRHSSEEAMDSPTSHQREIVQIYRALSDYYRYLAEVFSYPADIAMAEFHYEVALECADKYHLDGQDSVRLTLALNFSVFCNDVLQDTQRALDIAKEAQDGISVNYGYDPLLDGKIHEESETVILKLRDNIQLWTAELRAKPMYRALKRDLFYSIEVLIPSIMEGIGFKSEEYESAVFCHFNFESGQTNEAKVCRGATRRVHSHFIGSAHFDVLRSPKE
mmetsp:Transcript_31970/g.77889  ORF Transcript_31970/g.77889 Transcript_31970/m.77889 type:complete len:378 (+) Transcript_31970:170-1303(+)